MSDLEVLRQKVGILLFKERMLLLYSTVEPSTQSGSSKMLQAFAFTQVHEGKGSRSSKQGFAVSVDERTSQSQLQRQLILLFHGVMNLYTRGMVYKGSWGYG